MSVLVKIGGRQLFAQAAADRTQYLTLVPGGETSAIEISAVKEIIECRDCGKRHRAAACTQDDGVTNRRNGRL